MERGVFSMKIKDTRIVKSLPEKQLVYLMPSILNIDLNIDEICEVDVEKVVDPQKWLLEQNLSDLVISSPQSKEKIYVSDALRAYIAKAGVIKWKK